MEDIDVYHEVDSIRIERMADDRVWVAGFSEDEEYRYWFSVENGDLKVEREESSK